MMKYPWLPPPPGLGQRLERHVKLRGMTYIATYIRTCSCISYGVPPSTALFRCVRGRRGEREEGGGGGVKRFENGGRLSFLPDEEANIYRSRRHDDRFSVRLKRSPRREERERD